MKIDFTSNIEGFDQYEEVYSSLADKAWDYLNLQCEPIISISFVDNEFIHHLNKEYRNIDRPTDVISFAFLDGNNQREEMLHSKGIVSLGDIYISLDKAQEQAQEYGHPLDRELRFLFVHGLLHLLGYDHMTKKDEEKMFPLQEKILSL